MSALALVSPAGEGRLRPIPARRMAWVTWRQHRVGLGGAAGFVAALSVYLWRSGVNGHRAYTAATACRPVGSALCQQLVHNFNNNAAFLANGYLLQVVPGLIGAFVGAPLLARELETGTFRYAWTQGIGRTRWALGKLAMLAGTVLISSAALSIVMSWYYQPYFAPGNRNLSLTEWPSLYPGLFDLRGMVFAAWALAAFAIGCLAGTVLRRAVLAIAVTLAAYAALAMATGAFLRKHYQAPVLTRSLTLLPGSAWVLSQRWFTTDGRPASQAVIDRLLQTGGGQLAGKGGIPQASATWRYLAQHGYTQLTTYQPADRFWAFQGIETGWLLALSVLCIAGTVWLVRRPSR